MKNKLRPELADAGIELKKDMGAFMHAGATIKLETVSVARALQAAKDPKCTVLEMKPEAAKSAPADKPEPKDTKSDGKK